MGRLTRIHFELSTYANDDAMDIKNLKLVATFKQLKVYSIWLHLIR